MPEHKLLWLCEGERAMPSAGCARASFTDRGARVLCARDCARRSPEGEAWRQPLDGRETESVRSLANRALLPVWRRPWRGTDARCRSRSRRRGLSRPSWRGALLGGGVHRRPLSQTELTVVRACGEPARLFTLAARACSGGVYFRRRPKANLASYTNTKLGFRCALDEHSNSPDLRGVHVATRFRLDLSLQRHSVNS